MRIVVAVSALTAGDMERQEQGLKVLMWVV